jgi:hypothetical protein
MTTTDTILFFSLNNSASPQDEQIGEVCIANISPKVRKTRVRFAVQQLVVTLFVLGALVMLDVDPLWRLLLFFMFSAATTSYIQARDKT